MYQNWKQISSWQMMARHMLRNSCGWNLIEQSYSGSLGIRCLVKFISPQKTKKKKEEKRREYFLQTFRLYSYSYLPRLFCTEYFVTIPKFQQLLPKVWILSKTILDNCFFEVREYFKLFEIRLLLCIRKRKEESKWWSITWLKIPFSLSSICHAHCTPFGEQHVSNR